MIEWLIQQINVRPVHVDTCAGLLVGVNLNWFFHGVVNVQTGIT